MDATIRLRRDASLFDDDGVMRLTFPGGSAGWRDLPAGVRTALYAIASGDVDDIALGALVLPLDGPAGLARWHQLRSRLDAAGMLEHAVQVDGRVIARLRVLGRGPVRDTAPGERVKLSRFATARVADGVLLVSAPTSHLAVELYTTTLLGELADWTRTGDLSAESAAVLRLLAAADVLITEPEDTTRKLAQWRADDLWLHARVRGSQLTTSYGSTYPLRDRFGPLPVSPPARTAERIELVPPDLAVVAENDAPLTAAIESRRSVREHDDDRPITVEQLGELLYRTARTRRTFPGADGQELADRPYPSGGAVHELELYPLVTRCEGIEPGLYHYDGVTHALEPVAAAGPATDLLVQQGKSAGLMTSDPQVLLTVTARFGRVMWKYDTIAYSLILKHVGVLYQTIYLVATAMGLAVCGLGGGDAQAFATATGLDRFEEGSVGELVLGSRR
jgi:SagB-type dehydrogenase family enzyme